MTKKHVSGKVILIISGIVLLVIGLLIALLHWFPGSNGVKETADYYTEKISLAMPEVTEELPEKDTDEPGPVLEVDGLNFAGILEMPDYNRTLPVYGSWDPEKVRNFPCVYSGSAGSGNLIIGAGSGKGQIDFVKQISVQDRLAFTDVSGSRFSYEITDILHRDSIEESEWYDPDADFVLFVKVPTAFEYVIVTANAV